MKGNIEERACDLAVYIIENRTTVRAAAKKFGVSKSTVHTVDTLGVGSIWCLISQCDRTKGGMLSASMPPFTMKKKANEKIAPSLPPQVPLICWYRKIAGHRRKNLPTLCGAWQTTMPPTLCGVWADIVFFRLCSGRAVGRGRKTGDEGRGQASQPCGAVSNLFLTYCVI